MPVTYVKPLMSLNSVVILPPWSVTCFLALERHMCQQLWYGFIGRIVGVLLLELSGVGTILKRDL